MIALLVDVDLLVALHQLRLLVEVVYELLVVALEVVVYHVVEVWLVLDLYFLAVVLHQCSQHLAVCVVVPFVAVVLELDVVALGLLRLTVDDGSVLYAECPTGQLAVTPREGLIEECQRPCGLEALLVEALHQVEVELALQESRRVLPLANLLLVGGFLLDEADGVDTLVHADGVLPVVRALCVFRIVLDAYSLRGPHVAYHDVLLDLTGLVARLVLSIAAFTDAVAGEIAAGAAGIADGHRE